MVRSEFGQRKSQRSRTSETAERDLRDELGRSLLRVDVVALDLRVEEADLDTVVVEKRGGKGDLLNNELLKSNQASARSPAITGI